MRRDASKLDSRPEFQTSQMSRSPAQADMLRSDLIAAAHSLSRLQVTMIGLLVSQRRVGGRLVEPNWTVADIKPPSDWLGGFARNTALITAISRANLVIHELLSMARAPAPIDLVRAVAVMQFFGTTEWSPRMMRFAVRHGITLPNRPMDMPRVFELQRHLFAVEDRLRVPE